MLTLYVKYILPALDILDIVVKFSKKIRCYETNLVIFSQKFINKEKNKSFANRKDSESDQKDLGLREFLRLTG